MPVAAKKFLVTLYREITSHVGNECNLLTQHEDQKIQLPLAHILTKMKHFVVN